MITIIGSGPAGISCALYLKRANKEVQIITNDKSALNKAKYIENYYGTGKILGSELYNKGIDSVQELNIPVIHDEIINIDINDSFILEGINNKYNSDIIVLALGKIINTYSILGIEKYIGKGVSYCATCDGFFFKNKKIILVGNGKYSDIEYNYLTNITKDIIRLNKEDIKEIKGNDKVESVILNDDKEINIDGIFICDDHISTNALCKKVGILTNDDGVVVNENFETNIDNIYACGDIIPGIKQVSKAVNDGMLLATYLNSRR